MTESPIAVTAPGTKPGPAGGSVLVVGPVVLGECGVGAADPECRCCPDGAWGVAALLSRAIAIPVAARPATNATHARIQRVDGPRRPGEVASFTRQVSSLRQDRVSRAP